MIRMNGEYREFLGSVVIGTFPLSDGEGGEGAGGEGGAGVEGGEGGEGATPIDITKTPEFAAALKIESEKIVSDETTRLKNKNDELLQKVSDGKEKLKSFDGLDVEKVRVMLDQVAQSEEAKLISEGQLDEVIKRRVDKDRGGYEDQINGLKENEKTLVDQRDHYKLKYEENVIGDKIRKSAIAAGVNPQAMEDVLTRGKTIFSVNENGEVEARDRNGELLRANDNQLMTPDRFVENLKKDHPYYWPGSAGTGAKGSGIRMNEKDGMGVLTDVANSRGSDGQIDMNKYREVREGMSGKNYNKN